ncbi:hypothetical protein [Methanobacterium ferruginis]|uniref:hypothetical protein n=1 Tax=Methanobacterium ferruginis TaxID=710191 RepID=UPI002573BEE3|nr:hypothetical protein [Methanobacterium ferruginis]BDZ67951.1 hypothetical protein GCM10025860_13990 [Methanobacterium ferruginis]
MPIKGGPADKIGNRYEAYWTVACIIDVLREKADLIRIEPPGFQGEGVEFYLIKGAKREYYQVKRQKFEGKWTISSLKKVLKHFFKKLEDPTVICHFVSSSSATELEGLIERANGTYYSEFKSILKKPYLTAWESLINLLDAQGSEENVHEALKRIKVEIISEETLQKILLDYLETIISENPSDAKAWLFEYVFNQIGSELTINSIWKDLKTAGFHPTEWYNNKSVIGSLNDINERYLRRIREVEFSVNPIFREDTNKLLDKIKSNEDLIVTGTAGIGKSGIISQFLQELEINDTPFLVLDLENTKLEYSAKQLGLSMGLPGSPVGILANIAQGNECVFIIDQLDSLSIIQGKKVEFRDCIYELIEQINRYPNINLILVCRDFDLKNDKKLSNIQKKYDISEIKIKPLTDEELKNFIENDLKLDYTKFKESQLEILAVPLHLKLFCEIIEFDNSYLNFESEIELYNKYWDEKKRSIESKIGRKIEWDAVINSLCEYLTEKQDFKAPKILLDNYSADADIMASEGVLTSDSKYYGFFHGSFFDYAFARIFVSKEEDLLEFLLNDEQYLFKRSQVRQILSYKRSYGGILFDEYIEDVKAILNSHDVRIHIKILIFELFSKLNDPKELEWSLIEPFVLDKQNVLYNEAWKAIFRSIYWFDLLDSLGVIGDNLNSRDWDLIEKIMWFLYGMMGITERVAELIEPYVGKSNQWNELIVRYLVWADFSLGNKYFEILLSLIDRDIFENTESFQGDEYWDDIKRSVYRLAKTHPQRSIEIIAHYLNRKLELTSNKGYDNPFSEDSGLIPLRSFDDKKFQEMANQAPKEYVDKILPIMLNLMELNADKTSQKPFKDKIWRFRGYKESRYQNTEILLFSMEVALHRLSSDDPKSFHKWEDVLRKSDFETAHYLLIRSYAANPGKYANKTVKYLEKNPKSLKIGYYNASFWASRQLIESISPQCSYSKFKKLEKLLLNLFNHTQAYYKWVCTFKPNCCEDFTYYEYHNSNAQLSLLEGIPDSLRTNTMNIRIKQLNEIFEASSKKPCKTWGGFVGSPVDEELAAKLSDEEWLDAITKYDKEKDMLKGGPFELSRELEKLVKEDPERFSKLVNNFSDETNVHYFDAVLMGIAKSNADLDTVINVCKRCHALPNKPCGRWITQPIANFVGEKLPKEAIEMINYYLLNDPDPQEDLWSNKNSNRTVYYGGKIFEAGMNSARGMAALSLAKLLFDDKNLIPVFYSTLKESVKDPIISVRSCIAECLIAVLKYDPPKALELFKELCDTDDILLKTRQTERFLFYNLQDNFEDISVIINRMIFSEVPSVAIVGSRLISYAYLNGKNLLELNYCLNSFEFHRLGIAQVFSEYLAFSTPSKINDVLTMLFDDPSEDVRSEAARCFSKLNDENIDAYVGLIKEFVFSRAFKGNSRSLMYALNRIEILPEITLDISEQFFRIAGSEASDIRTETSATASIVANIIFKLYGQTKDSKIKTKCLDRIDNMLLGDYYTIQDKLSEYER